MTIFRNYGKIPKFMKNYEIMMSGNPDTNVDGILFFLLYDFTGNFVSLKSNFLAKSLSASVILARLQSAGCKYLIKHQLEH